MFGGGFFFLDEFVNESRYSTAAEAAGRLVFGFSFRVAHESLVKWFFRTDVVVVIKSQFAALAAL